MFSNGRDVIRVQQAQQPNFQSIQVVAYDKGEGHFFKIFRNGYTGEFYNSIDFEPNVSRPDQRQHYWVVNTERESGYVVVDLTLRRLSTERRHVEVIFDVRNSSIKGIHFLIEYRPRILSRIPFMYKAISRGYVENCEDELSL